MHAGQIRLRLRGTPRIDVRNFSFIWNILSQDPLVLIVAAIIVVLLALLVSTLCCGMVIYVKVRYRRSFIK